jgi:hypothetical protein
MPSGLFAAFACEEGIPPGKEKKKIKGVKK